MAALQCLHGRPARGTRSGVTIIFQQQFMYSTTERQYCSAAWNERAIDKDHTALKVRYDRDSGPERAKRSFGGHSDHFNMACTIQYCISHNSTIQLMSSANYYWTGRRDSMTSLGLLQVRSSHD